MPTSNAMSTALANKILDHTLGTVQHAFASQVYVALYTVAPTDAGGGTELSGNGYQRTAADFAAAANEGTSNSSSIEFPAATGSWGTLVAFALWDAASGGNFLYWGNLETPKAIGSGDVARFATGELQVGLD